MESKEIPHDIIVRTRDLCARYLGGAWNMISPEQIRIKAITYVSEIICIYYLYLSQK